MNRRDFLKRLAAATAAATAVAALDIEGADIERILWVPGEKKIFLPPEQGWQPAALITDRDTINAEARRLWDQGAFEHRQPQWVTMPDGKKHPVANEVHTAMGLARFDPHGNLLKIGRTVVTSARDHAALEASLYQMPNAGHRHGYRESFENALARHIVNRQRHGVYDEPPKPRRRHDYDW